MIYDTALLKLNLFAIMSFFYFKIFYWSIDLQCFVSFRCTIKCKLYIYIYSLLFSFFFNIGHYRVMRRVPCRSVLVIHFIYSSVYLSTQSHNLSISYDPMVTISSYYVLNSVCVFWYMLCDISILPLFPILNYHEVS